MFRVTSSGNYFLSELAYSSESELTNCKPLSLHVMTLGDKNVCAQSETTDVYESKISSIVHQSSAIDVHCVNMESSCRDGVLPRGCDCCIMRDESSDQHRLLNNSDSNTKAMCEFVDVENAVRRLSTMLAQHCKSGCFILDIDLDVFSTMNPFLSSLSQQQYQLLSELYAYRPPPDRSVEVCLVLILCHYLCQRANFCQKSVCG